ncbi:MAG: alpha-glucan family phosphorylase, partial [Candidatus Altiarchaeales archaeon]|nr:alpha-glucan family phosphorylase [Candidatus Altiarchaeales archaeon]
KMFPHYHIESITNGIHVPSWVCPPLAELFDEYIPSWRVDSYALRNALKIPYPRIWDAHMKAKAGLLDFVNTHYKTNLGADVLTLGFARRATSYKRADLIFSDIDRLRDIAGYAGGLQLIFAGKAHPRDEAGKKLIKKIVDKAKELSNDLKIIYLQNYDIYSAKYLVSGCDVWLNTPRRPREASGTSGMKAAVNGVLNLSVLDGWWIEGHVEGFTGWSIGSLSGESDDKQDAEDLYGKLERKILPLYYGDRGGWMQMMASNIAFNGSFFNTQRMASQYVMHAYFQ